MFAELDIGLFVAEWLIKINSYDRHILKKKYLAE